MSCPNLIITLFFLGRSLPNWPSSLPLPLSKLVFSLALLHHDLAVWKLWSKLRVYIMARNWVINLLGWEERPVIGGNWEMDGVLGIILKWKKQTIHHGFCINWEHNSPNGFIDGLPFITWNTFSCRIDWSASSWNGISWLFIHSFHSTLTFYFSIFSWNGISCLFLLFVSMWQII